MRHLIESISFATLIAITIPLRAFSTPANTAQRQSSQFDQIHQNHINSSPRKDEVTQTQPVNPATSKLPKDQDSQLLPPFDAELGFETTVGKCSPVEIIGPEGTCIPTPM